MDRDERADRGRRAAPDRRRADGAGASHPGDQKSDEADPREHRKAQADRKMQPALVRHAVSDASNAARSARSTRRAQLAWRVKSPAAMPSKPDVSILYFRPYDASLTALDGKLFELASRNRGHARLVVRHTDERGNLLGGWVSGQSATVLFVRDGNTVAQLVGDAPAHELERLLASALRCDRDEVRRLEARSAG